MNNYAFTPPPISTLPISGCNERFAISRVFCLGRNYPWGDSQDLVRQAPVFFMKPSTSVIDACGEMAYPPLTDEFCHEVELVIAIGKGGLNITEGQALEHVWGYSLGLDMTRRDLQKTAKAGGMPWEGAKVFDGSAPMTPVVPVSLCGHPCEGDVWLSVNGVERQRSRLEAQIWSVKEVISRLSQSLTLCAGDLIMTGTPPGVAALSPGDVINAGIDGVGQLEMRVGERPTN